MSAEKSLDALRREIDAIDDSIHDLIMRRTTVVKKVREVKRGERTKIRPAREAEILYRLIDQHKGDFPKRELCRMWREMIVATLSMEGPFSVAMYKPDEGCGYGDLARDQYGSFAPMTEHISERRVIDAVGSQEATVGILPMPSWDDPDPWWRHLANGGERAPKVIARLPFIGMGNGRNRDLEAMVICPVEHRPTGRDRSLFAVETDHEIALASLGEMFSGAGAPLVSSFVWNNRQADGQWMYLAEASDFVGGGDPRITRLAQTPPIGRVVPLGGYATPLSEGELNRGDGS